MIEHRLSTASVARIEPPLPLIDTLLALRDALDRPLSREENAFLSRRFAGGATRAQIDALAAQFSGAAAAESKVA